MHDKGSFWLGFLAGAFTVLLLGGLVVTGVLRDAHQQAEVQRVAAEEDRAEAEDLKKQLRDMEEAEGRMQKGEEP